MIFYKRRRRENEGNISWNSLDAAVAVYKYVDVGV
jgi:hypothetical protein